jgi:hypothetical protein
MTEIADFAAILFLVTGAVALAVMSTALTGRIPVPAPAIFLVTAALVSDIWPQVYEHVPILTVERVAVVALVVILFNGGIDIGWGQISAALPARSCRSASWEPLQRPACWLCSHTSRSGSTGRWRGSSAPLWHRPTRR